jgi:hypothetical protein
MRDNFPDIHNIAFEDLTPDMRETIARVPRIEMIVNNSIRQSGLQRHQSGLGTFGAPLDLESGAMSAGTMNRLFPEQNVALFKECGFAVERRANPTDPNICFYRLVPV